MSPMNIKVMIEKANLWLALLKTHTINEEPNSTKMGHEPSIFLCEVGHLIHWATQPYKNYGTIMYLNFKIVFLIKMHLNQMPYIKLLYQNYKNKTPNHPVLTIAI